MLKSTLIALAIVLSLFSCNSDKPAKGCQDLPEIPAEGEKMYIAIGTNRDGTKSSQHAILVVNITSRFDSVLSKRLIVIDTTFALQRPTTVKDSTGKEVPRFVWTVTTRDSIKLVNPLPVDSLIKQ